MVFKIKVSFQAALVVDIESGYGMGQAQALGATIRTRQVASVSRSTMLSYGSAIYNDTRTKLPCVTTGQSARKSVSDMIGHHLA
jgi:hypothetical protein